MAIFSQKCKKWKVFQNFQKCEKKCEKSVSTFFSVFWHRSVARVPIYALLGEPPKNTRNPLCKDFRRDRENGGTIVRAQGGFLAPPGTPQKSTPRDTPRTPCRPGLVQELPGPEDVVHFKPTKGQIEKQYFQDQKSLDQYDVSRERWIYVWFKPTYPMVSNSGVSGSRSPDVRVPKSRNPEVVILDFSRFTHVADDLFDTCNDCEFCVCVTQPF